MAKAVSYQHLKPRSDPGPVRMGFVVHDLAMEQVFLPVLQFTPVSIIK
jgi:hypothetical protein